MKPGTLGGSAAPSGSPRSLLSATFQVETGETDAVKAAFPGSEFVDSKSVSNARIEERDPL
jgi:hypothetical protein